MKITDVEISTLYTRLEALEMKLSFQEDTIEQLNDVVSSQTIEIQKLWDANRLLKTSLSELRARQPGSNEAEPPPPHY